MKNNNGCKYCGSYDAAGAEESKLEQERIVSNINGTIPRNSPYFYKAHEGFFAKIIDNGSDLDMIDSTEYKKYIEWAKENPGLMWIQSEAAGKKLFFPNTDCPLIIEIKINYCPICGRKLGVKPTDI